MAIFTRGKIYHCSFQVNGRKHRRSLKTSDHSQARERYEQMRRVAKQVAAAPAPKMQPTPSDWSSLSDSDLSAIARAMTGGMRHRARKKGMSCSMTAEDVLALLRECGGRCSVTAMPLAVSGSVSGRRVSPWMPSIDRIKSDRGYEIGNCRIVCYLANIAMSQYGEEALEAMLFSYGNYRWGASEGKPKSRGN